MEQDDFLFGGGVAFGAALVAIVWMVVSLTGGDSDPASTAATSPVRNGLLGTAATPAPAPDQRCHDAARILAAPLEAARPAMDQWQVHIGAMNQLVVGAITLQDANAFWNQTRVGAQHRIAAFRSAMKEMRRSGVDCPAPDMLPRTASSSLRSCVNQVDADMRVLAAARTAIATWHMHVADMERLRAGKLSGAKASQMWLAMWHEGQQQVTDYRKAAHEATRAGSCDGTSVAQPSPSQGAPPGPTDSPTMDMPGMG